jgi:hypothetical protein
VIRVFQTDKPQMRKLKKKRSSWSITSGLPVIRPQSAVKVLGIRLTKLSDSTSAICSLQGRASLIFSRQGHPILLRVPD